MDRNFLILIFQVLVSLKAAGINPTETYARAGKYTGCRTISVPFTPGGDGAGVIEEVGNECTKFKVIYALFTTHLQYNITFSYYFN